MSPDDTIEGQQGPQEGLQQLVRPNVNEGITGERWHETDGFEEEDAAFDDPQNVYGGPCLTSANSV